MPYSRWFYEKIIDFHEMMRKNAFLSIRKNAFLSIYIIAANFYFLCMANWKIIDK